MATPAVPFLNLQYIYCYFADLFGKACGVGGVLPDVDVTVPTTTLPSMPVAESSGGFWSWLWPFGSSSSEVVTATTSAASDVGFWAGLFNALPQFMQSTLLGIGAVVDFLWTVFSWLSFTASGILFLIILFAAAGLILIRMQEWQDYNTLPPVSGVPKQSRTRWQDLLNEAMATEPKRWRVAIVAADDMLGIILTRLGYHGKTTGDQLRGVPEGAFVTLPAAWEAHRVKSFVAARSSDFILTQREAFRVMKLYEQVFEEFDFI